MNKPQLYYRVILRIAAAVSALFIAFAVNAAARDADGVAVASSGRVALTGHVLPALATATLDSSKAKAITNDEPLTLTVVLNRSDQVSFDRYLGDVYDRQSPRFRKFLTAQEIADTFGPSREDFQRVRTHFEQSGFTISEDASSRMAMSITASRTTVESTLNVGLGEYFIGDRHFFANDTDPQLPAAIAARVQAVIGLSDLARPKPMGEAIVRPFKKYWCRQSAESSGGSVSTTQALKYCEDEVDSCSTNLKLNAADKADIKKVCEKFRVPAPPPSPSMALLSGSKSLPAGAPPWKDASGAGQKVGLIQFDTFVPSDVSNYLDLFGMPDSVFANLSQVHVGGGATLGVNQSEVLLDVNTVLMGAPDAKVVVYDAPFTGGGSFQALFNRALSDGMTIISNSWAYCEDQTSFADVQSIDTILATAAAAGISVFNASGDSGSTCLNGSRNTIVVPAGSPHATAVGGTSLKTGPTAVYDSESWWNGASDTPPTGSGGFGVSRFFSRPTYQDGFTASAMRSIPDVAFGADPASGVILCQASLGGCPTGLFFGGTSFAAPALATAAAILNQAAGQNLGNFNLSLYPLSQTSAFHTASSMGSDFEHVGLGSPNLNKLYLALTAQTAGPMSATQSKIRIVSDQVDADGTSSTSVVVRLRDADGNSISGRSVTLSASPAGNVVITPASAVTSTANGAALFKVSNLVSQTVTLTATNTTDGIAVQQQPQIVFGVPAAAGGSIVAVNGSAAADGVSTATIVVTLQDSLGRPTPGKLISLAAAGNAVIKGPSPSVTDANGQIQFTATNTKVEGVFFIATDVTDGDLRVPGVAFVNFTAGGGDNCGNTNMGDPNINAASGYAIKSFATGFTPGSVFFGNIGPGCRGASGLAFDASGNLFVGFSRTGDIYKFGAAGGAAGPATLVTPTALGPGLLGLTFGLDGKLYGAFQATTGDFFTGAVREINPVTGAIVRTVSAPITCASYIATDPISGDLFVDDSCFGAGSDNGSIWRISNPGSATPTTTIYAATPGFNGGLTFSSGGTLYVLSYTQNGVAKITGTNKPQPPTVTVLPGLTGPALNVVALGAQANGDAKTLLLSNQADPSGFPAGIKVFDITGNPVTTSAILVNNAFASVQITGPDGCQYASMSVAVFKITNADGSCPLVLAAPTLSLSPPVVRPDPAQGTARTFTASFHFVNVPVGTPVFFTVYGANALQGLVRTNASGIATYTYTAFSTGEDTVFATATVGNTTYASNLAKVTWATGLHITSLDLNLSPTGGFAGTRTTLSGALFDLSATPIAAIAGATINFTVGSQSCNAVTNASGIASCFLILSTVGNFTLTASFAGTAQNSSATASTGFAVTAPRSLDVDGNGTVDALTDGLLLVRWLSNPSRTGSALVNRAIGTGATRVISPDVVAYLTALMPVLDIDGNGQFDALTDGLLIVRYLSGFRGDALIEAALGAGATRSSSADIEAYIQSLLPA